MATNNCIVSMTHLDTLLGVLDQRLNKLSTRVEAANLPTSHGAGIVSSVEHLHNLFGMVAEIAVSQEALLHDVARTLSKLQEAGPADPDDLGEVLAQFSNRLGKQAAERLFAAALLEE